MAGTTAVALLEGEKVEVRISEKGRSADDFILRIIEEHNPLLVAIDAPLSLPGIYNEPETYDDYFYRKGDKELGAMSPMFLGGLTARAIKIRDHLIGRGIKVIETYPSQLAKKFTLHQFGYRDKDRLQECTEKLTSLVPWKLPEGICTWHELDAMLALWSANRLLDGNSEVYGDPGEGQIYI